MGGAVGDGNVTPAAEFNIWADPEAAARVFASGIDLTMVGLDVTHKALFTPAHEQRLEGRVGAVVRALLEFYGAFHRRSTAGTARRSTTRSPSRTSPGRISWRRFTAA